MSSRSLLLATAIATAVLAGCLSSEERAPPPPPPPLPTPSTPSDARFEFPGTLPQPAPGHFMGAPCEEEQSCRTHPANVSAGRGELAAILDWDAPTLGDLSPTDMDLEVFNPKGEQVSGMQSASQNKPEIFTLKGNMTGGDWHFRVVNYAGTNLAYTLTVEVTYGTAANRTGNATLTPRS